MTDRSRPGVTTILWYVVALATGALVGLVGTIAHRQWMPWILLLALVSVAAAAVLMRAWLGGGGVAAYAVGWFVMVQALALEGPGGDIILPAQLSTYVWMLGGLLVIAGAVFAPRRWFAA